MDDVRIKFYGKDDNESHTLEVYSTNDKGIYVEISIEDSPYCAWITLNKATAVQLVKKLKLEISKINQDG